MIDRAKGLFRNLAIYGLGDVATSLISLLLLPIYTRYLSPSDYGIIAMLLTVEAVMKVLFRWGVDTAFMRLYYDCADQAARQRLASTLFFFLLAVNGAILAVAVGLAGGLSHQLFGTAEHGVLIALVLANTFVAGFYFIPLQVLRISEQPKQFIALVFARSAGTLLARLALVIGAGMGVLGVVLADVIVTVLFTIVLSRWFAPLIRPVFSRQILADAVGFGLPRIPHSLAHHVMGLADRYFLNAFGTLRDVGLYSIGASFGLALKLFVSAFDSAWTPLYLGIMKDPDARQIISRLSTYAIGALVCLVAGWCATGPDVVRLATAPEFHEAARVTPWISLAAMFQGFYVIGSVGLIITKRTTLYPIATGIAALTSVVANVVLIPRYGLVGAAWATCLAYGTLVVVTVGFSFRLYPIPYEWSRLLRIALAGIAAYFGATLLVSRDVDPLPGFLFHGVAALSIYTAMLFATGFFHQGEIGELRNIRERALRRRAVRPTVPQSDDTEMAGEIVSPSEPPDVRLVETESEPPQKASDDDAVRGGRDRR